MHGGILWLHVGTNKPPCFTLPSVSLSPSPPPFPCLLSPSRPQWWNDTGAVWIYRAALVSAVTFVAVPELAAAARLKVPRGTEVPKGLWVAAAGLLFKAVSTAVAARMDRVDA